MIAARVAGVPRPVSFIASESSFSSSVLPAVSIAVSSVASVNRFGGRVFFFSASTSSTSCGCPCARFGGKLCSSAPALDLRSTWISRAFQPTCSTAVPEVR